MMGQLKECVGSVDYREASNCLCGKVLGMHNDLIFLKVTIKDWNYH